ncbi:hypothetical protein [[Flexibacter] sp. ATCC 35208]|uniref:hypothetical protein n=1 Tax=[Flexibacter] sp. ATCC 35208 TaxID=1936242 RepID=UPI0009C8A980|nr:hypothetical protein [[Flexibacter] sp. ATCC 35208]OMP74748.1 hypothetical protein BW716_33725 [[Flexibacter] sp. ATCC 35208]
MKQIVLTIFLITCRTLSYGQLYQDFFIGWKSAEVKSYLACKRVDKKNIDIPGDPAKPHIIQWRDIESLCIVTTFFDNTDHVASINFIPFTEYGQKAMIDYLNGTSMRTTPDSSPGMDDYWMHIYDSKVYKITMEVNKGNATFFVKTGK